jgi:siroheme synthase (precorrin-2 oxidase/ferrochelatase)
VTVADDPNAGNFVMPSVHRSGDLTISVSAGRAPAVATAIRSVIGRRFDGRYAAAIVKLRELRERLLRAGYRDEWKRASSELIGDDFCESVEQGTLEARIASWR